MILERPDLPPPGPKEVRAGLDRHTLSNGVAAFLLAVTGPLVILIGVGVDAGMSKADISSWVLGGYGVGGVLSILFSLAFRQPLGLAWTIPGVVLVGASLNHLPFDEVVGAFLVTAALLFVLGITGWVGRIMKVIPLPIVMGMVAGVFLPLAIRIVTAFAETAVIATVTLAAFVGVSLVPAIARLLPPVLAALAAGALAAVATGDFAPEGAVHWTIAEPVIYVPRFSYQACFELVVPLAITVVGIHNAQGFAILRDAGYTPPANLLTVACGVGSVFAAVVGAVPTCVTGPANGILNSSGAKPRRFVGGIVFGVLLATFGLFAPVATTLALALPAAFIGMLGGLALLPVLQGAFVSAFAGKARLGALVSFMVTVSDVTILNIGAAFWGLVFGLAASLAFERKEVRETRSGS